MIYKAIKDLLKLGPEALGGDGGKEWNAKQGEKVLYIKEEDWFELTELVRHSAICNEIHKRLRLVDGETDRMTSSFMFGFMAGVLYRSSKARHSYFDYRNRKKSS